MTEAYLLRFHDYASIYACPGLYGRLFHDSGFSSLVADLVRRGVLEVRRRRRYEHRLATNGDPIFYIAVVAEKMQPE